MLDELEQVASAGVRRLNSVCLSYFTSRLLNNILMAFRTSMQIRGCDEQHDLDNTKY